MKRVEVLYHKRYSNPELGLAESDEDFEKRIAFLDLNNVQSLNEGKDWMGLKTFHAYLPSTNYAIVGDMISFAEEVERVKQFGFLGVN